MNYFLLANNKEFSESTINKLRLNPDNDILVLFNFLVPLKFDRIRDYTNKICITRKRPIELTIDSKIYPNIKEYYANISYIRYNQNLFQKIYFLPCYSSLKNNLILYQKTIDLLQFDMDKVHCIDYDIDTMAKKLNYYKPGKQKEVSTGIIVYEYLKDYKNKEDKIILVSFTSDLSKTYHDCDWEKQYFLNEINNDYCYCIDSYEKTNFIF